MKDTIFSLVIIFSLFVGINSLLCSLHEQKSPPFRFSPQIAAATADGGPLRLLYRSGRCHCSISAERLLNFAGRGSLEERCTHNYSHQRYCSRWTLYRIISISCDAVGLFDMGYARISFTPIPCYASRGEVLRLRWWAHPTQSWQDVPDGRCSQTAWHSPPPLHPRVPNQPASVTHCPCPAGHKGTQNPRYASVCSSDTYPHPPKLYVFSRLFTWFPCSYYSTFCRKMQWFQWILGCGVNCN